MDRSTPEGRAISLSPISTADGDQDQSRVPLLSPLASSDGLGGSRATIDFSDGEGKQSKAKVKRKDTASSSFTNFFQRFSRSSAEIKADDHHKLERGDAPLIEEEETVFMERPDFLPMPEEEQWFESRTSFDKLAGGWTTALEPTMSTIVDETRLGQVAFTPHHEPYVDKSESHAEMQKALEFLLEDFRSGNMGGLTDVQLAQLDATRRAHETITDTHRILVAETWDTVCEQEENALRESYDRMYDLLDIVHSHVDQPGPSQ